ncbi:MAG: glycosyltransferase family 2 protein [Desulfotomaculaceae bacterium]|nr:glycosyltransferase family 2 protein [Desulfotomaculaceae bacterium]
MYRGKSIGVVVPAYNEELLIGRVLENMPAYVDKVYVVDDCSIDKTINVVRSKRNFRVVIQRHKKNLGVGAAIVTGYRRALQDRLDIVAVMAGDDQMDPGELNKLLDPIVEGQADYSKGDRLSRRGLAAGMSTWRKFGNSLLTQLTRISSGYWLVQDPQNGYTAISREALNGLDLGSIYRGYGYCNDLLAKLNVLGLRVLDVPIPARYGEEKSKIRYGSYMRKVSFLLLRNFLWRIVVQYIYPRPKLPGVGYLSGFLFLSAGMSTLLASILARPNIKTGVLLFLTGVLQIILSLALDAFMRLKVSRTSPFDDYG